MSQRILLVTVFKFQVSETVSPGSGRWQTTSGTDFLTSRPTVRDNATVFSYQPATLSTEPLPMPDSWR